MGWLGLGLPMSAMTAIPAAPLRPVSRSPRLKDLAETSPGISPDQNSASGNHTVTAGYPPVNAPPGLARCLKLLVFKDHDSTLPLTEACAWYHRIYIFVKQNRD